MFPYDELHAFYYDGEASSPDINDEIYDHLIHTAFVDEIPYGTQKARTGDPHQAIWDIMGNLSFEQFLKLFK